jgi:hypothetical protein
MMRGHEPPERGKPFGPFGDIGDEIAGEAEHLIGYLSEEPEPIVLGTTELPDSDEAALSMWIGMEWLIPIVDAPNEHLDGEIRRQAHDAVVAFHVALPYNEAERQWLDRMCMRQGSKNFFEHIQDQEARLMVAGVRRVVSGRELMQRWMMWRRGAGEFAGQDAVAEARDALRRVQDVLG